MSKRAATKEEDKEPQPFDLESLDPLDPRKVSLDIFELYCHEMIMSEEVERRAYLIKKLRYMIHRLIGQQYEYGRCYNYTTVANMCARICGRHAYYKEGQDDSIELNGRLIDFDSEKWVTVMDQFVKLRDSLIRKDASLTVLPTEIEGILGADEEDDDLIPEENDEIDTALGSSDAFSESFEQMRDWLKFHACMSNIQPQFDNAIQGGTDVIPRKSIVAFEKGINDLFAGCDEDNDFVIILTSLLTKSKSTKKKSKESSLKSFDEIKAIYTDYSRVFDLEKFQAKFLKLIRQWAHMVLPFPDLAKCGYGGVNVNRNENVGETEENTLSVEEDIDYGNANNGGMSEESSCEQEKASKPKKQPKNAEDAVFDGSDEISEAQPEMHALKRKRDSFGKKVKDPLDASIAYAAGLPSRTENRHSAVRSEEVMPKFYQKMESAQRLEWTSDDDGESSEDEVGDLTMSNVPERFNLQTESKPDVKSVQTSGQSSAPPKKRKKFTDEEDNAIMKGIDRFGVGKWAEIKSHFPMELRDRGTVQIKDRYRTLTKSAE